MDTAAWSGVVAIIAAYNEADIIGQVVGDLVAQGVGVYLLDNGSTDGTVAEVMPYLGQGLLAVERFPAEDTGSEEAPRVFDWERILRRKEALAWQVAAEWFIHHDADEFRESPWTGVALADAVRRVDALGYNAIDFAVWEFPPIHDRFRPGDDVRETFPLCRPGQPRDRVQIKCWKRGTAPVDLVSTGGHEVRFPGRRVFPLRFIVRHYPIRGQAHGERKVFRERLPRFLQTERERGWHVQYDAMIEGQSFLGNPSELTRYDPEAVRLQLALHHRGIEELEAEGARQTAAFARETAVLNQEIAALTHRVTELEREAGQLRAALEDTDRRLTAVYASWSWRLMAPLRALYRLVGGS